MSNLTCQNNEESDSLIDVHSPDLKNKKSYYVAVTGNNVVSPQVGKQRVFETYSLLQLPLPSSFASSSSTLNFLRPAAVSFCISILLT